MSSMMGRLSDDPRDGNVLVTHPYRTHCSLRIVEDGGVQPQPAGYVQSRIIVNVAQHNIINLLKAL